MKNLTKLFLSTVLSIVGISAVGQSPELGYSLGLKVGPGVFEKRYIEGVDLNLTTSKFIYSASYSYSQELDILTPNPREYFNQANLLFGSFVGSKSFRFEYQGGVGVIWGKRRTTLEYSGFLVDSYSSRKFETIGIPIRGCVKYIPFQFMSIGLEVMVNINPEKTIALPMLALNFGRILNKK